jgi:acyl-coenzyme A thioesterase PaaI-like protein
MTEPNTHSEIDQELCGEPLELAEGRGSARFVATQKMNTDAHGLVHGGFIFGLADHAAMLAVNDPHVVLGSADVRFIAPVVVGDVVIATAEVTEEKGKKRVLSVSAKVGDKEVLSGTMVAFVLDRSVTES